MAKGAILAVFIIRKNMTGKFIVFDEYVGRLRLSVLCLHIFEKPISMLHHITTGKNGNVMLLAIVCHTYETPYRCCIGKRTPGNMAGYDNKHDVYVITDKKLFKQRTSRTKLNKAEESCSKVIIM